MRGCMNLGWKGEIAMLDNATPKIASFRDLEPGWCFGEGVGPQENVIALATRLNALAAEHGFDSSDAFPGVNGEIQVDFNRGNKCYEFIIETDESITYYVEEEIGSDWVDKEHREGLTMSEAEALVSRVGR